MTTTKKVLGQLYYVANRFTSFSGREFSIWLPKSWPEIDEKILQKLQGHYEHDIIYDNSRRFYSGNPDYGFFDCVTYQRTLKKTGDIVVYGLLVRPFTDKQQLEYERFCADCYHRPISYNMALNWTNLKKKS